MHLARSFAFAATIVTFALSHTSGAMAQSVEPSSTGKGIVGGTLLGAELVLLTEAAIDVSPEWLYYVGGAAGAVGGGVAGYFLEDKLTSKSNMLLLAGGMLLVIPTTVAVLSATAYEQPAEYTQDSHPKDELPADPAIPASPASPTAPAGDGTAPTPSDGSTPPGAPGSPTPATTPAAPTQSPAPGSTLTSHNHHKRRIRPSLPPPALVGIDAQKRVHWGIPAVEVRDTFSRVEVAQFGVQQKTELRIPVLRVAF
ncbi:MAG TPA: hypothetical protein VKP30_04235 [Polyangiaceae bacterium]|nr:hypothetical protein [Polyangiaceae bacterium]